MYADFACSLTRACHLSMGIFCCMRHCCGNFTCYTPHTPPSLHRTSTPTTSAALLRSCASPPRAPPRARPPPPQLASAARLDGQQRHQRHRRWDEAKTTGAPSARRHSRCALAAWGGRRLTTLSSAFSSRVRSATPRSGRPKRFARCALQISPAPRRPHWPARLTSQPLHSALLYPHIQDTTTFLAAACISTPSQSPHYGRR